MNDTSWTSHGRVKAALEHREPDRVPFDLGGSVLTGMSRVAYWNLRNALSFPDLQIELQDQVQQLARIHQDVLDRLRVDVRCVDPDPPHTAPLARPVIDEGHYYSLTDEWGIVWKMPVNDGFYFDMRKHPLPDAGIADLAKYPWPDPEDPGRFETMRERAEQYTREEERAYILGRHSAGIFEMALWTRGFEKFFIDLALDPLFAEALLDTITDLKIRYWGKALETVGTNVMIVSEADDIATQRGPMISPEMYRKFISPRHKRLFDFIRKKAQSKVYLFYHSCGAVKEFIPTLIEEGVDILNPVQISAAGMDTAELKRQFGRDITFWGGGIDTQHVLPNGTPQQVRDEVKRRIDDLAPGGGFVFNTVHNVQADVPPQNYLAMWEALQEYGGY